MRTAHRVVVNTGVLHLRIVITILISLYSVRLILSALGESDFGIYNLVAGIVAMLAFVNSALWGSTQRFLSYYQGLDDLQMQRKVFCSSVALHAALGIGVVVALETIGLLFFNGFLNIPADRLDTAKFVYHFMSATVFFSIFGTPFVASIIAHEDMMWNALINILEAVLKLGVAGLLFWLPGDRLAVYAVLIGGIGLTSLVCYMWVSLKKYPECTLRIRDWIDRSVLSGLGSFTGWNLLGALSGVARAHGTALILNLNFNTRVNAAYGISNQVNGQLSSFSATMSQAISPQIMKSEGNSDRERMIRLSMINTKFCYFILAFVGIPCIFEMTEVLRVWLKTVPEYALIFCQLGLLYSLVYQLTGGMLSAVNAIGRIRNFQIVNVSMMLASLGVAYILLRSGFPPYSVFVCFIVQEIVAGTYRIGYLSRHAGLSPSEYLRRVAGRCLMPTLVSLGVCWVMVGQLDMEYRWLFTFPAAAAAFMTAAYFFGLCKDEKKIVDGVFVKFLQQAAARMGRPVR